MYGMMKFNVHKIMSEIMHKSNCLKNNLKFPQN